MRSSIKLLTLIDKIQAEVDEYVQMHETLLRSYAQLLEENDRLKDTIALLADKDYESRYPRQDDPEAN